MSLWWSLVDSTNPASGAMATCRIAKGRHMPPQKLQAPKSLQMTCMLNQLVIAHGGCSRCRTAHSARHESVEAVASLQDTPARL